ncbi:TPA: helix-turn-helix transcriptional regulator [Streptococcus agalactiae]|uniref:helix-turn-helix domain-containing protein n=2 Tax=Streptococcus TaxID=1301 RepID=UPI0002B9F6E7|nr:helix-turn-helix transcriptional regulator [Streptococcus agalactiae]EPU45419.1 XRE family transcriptional regulator [Streptococcus agalactiae LDS 628]
MKMFEVYSRIEALAKKRGVSLQKVATDIGLSENYIYNLKSKKTANTDPIEKIANYFNVSTDYLLGRTDNPKIAQDGHASVAIDLKKDAEETFFFDGHELNDEDIDLITSILETRIKNRK